MTSSRPLVSVIIPNYNYSRTLRMCIAAVQAQTYRPIEVTVVDDCSTDDSVAIAESLGVKVLRTPGNGGVATARNLGAAAANGAVLLFLDSDIALDPTAVERAVERLTGIPKAGAVCGVYEPTPLIRDSLVEEYRSLQAHYWRITSEGPVSFLFPSICAMRAEVLAEIGPFNPRLRQTEEVDYGFRLSRRYDILLTAAVRGRHDDDDRLWPLLRKLFVRGRLRVPLYSRMRRFARGFETASRAWGTLAALAAVATVPLPFVFGPIWTVPPVLLLIASIFCDRGMYGFVARARGLRFSAGFCVFQFLVNLAIASGVACGVVQWALSPSFRRLYDPAAGTAGTSEATAAATAQRTAQ